MRGPTNDVPKKNWEAQMTERYPGIEPFLERIWTLTRIVGPSTRQSGKLETGAAVDTWLDRLTRSRDKLIERENKTRLAEQLKAQEKTAAAQERHHGKDRATTS